MTVSLPIAIRLVIQYNRRPPNDGRGWEYLGKRGLCGGCSLALPGESQGVAINSSLEIAMMELGLMRNVEYGTSCAKFFPPW